MPGRFAIAGVASLLLSGLSAGGQAPRPAPLAPQVSQEFLASIVHLDCAFAVEAAGQWSGSAPSARTRTLPNPFRLRFVDINVAEGSATADAGGHRTAVSARSDRSNLYLLETGPGDVIQLTVVFSQQTATGRLRAVHTRSGRDAMQFYGDCAADR